MRVRVGWSGETDGNVWRKADVELEEQDLHRIMIDNDLPDELHERLPVKFAYQLLALEAEALLLGKLVALGYPSGTAMERVKSIENNQAAMLAALKQKYTPAVA